MLHLVPDQIVLWEWLAFAIRWTHVITAIAWIGSSFYFIALDLGLQKAPHLPKGAHGEEWQVHGGGFYHITKYLVAPARMPEHLTWFKWESYATWLSGFALLFLVYYVGADLYLIDRSVADLPVWGASLIGMLGLGLGWIVYDFICKSRLKENDTALLAALFVYVVAASFVFSQLFSGRGAMLHTGAMIATIMTANVFFIIIPNQKIVVADLRAGRTPEAYLGKQAKQRSLHNNYLTLPVIFLMLSNHYPLAFASQYNWLILAALGALSVLARHYFNTRHDSNRFAWALPAAAVGMICLAFVTSPNRPSSTPNLTATTPEQASAAAQAHGDAPRFSEINEVIEQRCTVCHSANPSSPMFSSAPAGVMFDTPEQIRQQAAKIHAQTVASQIMPLGNITQMTQEERDLLGAWIAKGAPTN